MEGQQLNINGEVDERPEPGEEVSIDESLKNDRHAFYEIVNKAAKPQERIFQVDLSLTLTPAGDKALKIPIFLGKLRGALVEEALGVAIETRQFKKLLHAALDLPEELRKLIQDQTSIQQ